MSLRVSRPGLFETVPIDLIALELTEHSEVEDYFPLNQARALAAALVRFAEGFEGSVIAEGVEKEADLEALRALGVRAAQGYHIARPLSLEAFHQSSSAAEAQAKRGRLSRRAGPGKHREWHRPSRLSRPGGSPAP